MSDTTINDGVGIGAMKMTPRVGARGGWGRRGGRGRGGNPRIRKTLRMATLHSTAREGTKDSSREVLTKSSTSR